MKIRLIQSLEVFDLVHTHYKQPRTLLSLSLDGRKYFSLELPGVRKLSSGKNVFVAFEDESESRVLAWLDPASEEFLLIDGWDSGLLLVPGLLGALLVGKLLSVVGASLQVSAAIGCGVFLFVVFVASSSGSSRHRLESQLREKLGTTKR